MTRDFMMPRTVLIYLITIPLALILGYVLANPLDLRNLGVLSFCLFFLAFPMFIRWHHSMLVATFNAALIVYFLPGSPALWVLLALINLGFAIVNRTLRKQDSFIHVPSVAWAMVFIGTVVVGTAAVTGGIGARVLGSDVFGGSRYFYTIAAIIGYFGLVTQPIPRERALPLAALFFLGGLTAAGSDLIYYLGPKFYFLFILFPSEMAYMQAITEGGLNRTTGLAWGSLAIFYALLLAYGIRGILNLYRPWRLLLFVGAVVSCFFGGYRSSVIVMAIVLTMQFFFEGLHRTKFLPIMMVIAVVSGPLFLANMERMPLTVQRSFSFLPVKVHPMARADAVGTMDWRLAMWQIMVPEVPKYLLLGRGYSFSGSEFYLANEAIRQGVYREYEAALVTGEYHNGILTLLVPFGIWGLGGFLWLGWASLVVLWRNWKYGDPQLKKVNTFLLAYYAARYLVYFTVYGQFEKEFVVFTGIIGLSIALNNGVRKPEDTLEVPPGKAEAEAVPEDAAPRIPMMLGQHR